MQLDARSVQSRRERALREELSEDYGVRKAVARIKELTHGRGYGYRRSLLSRALRLTRSMSPEIADTIAECKEMLGYPYPIEIYIQSGAEFNASCFREDHGPTVLTLTSRLLEELRIARTDGSYKKAFRALARLDLLILDDFGLKPMSQTERHDLLELIEDRHELRSTLITSQLKISLWHSFIGEPTVADAFLDRILSNAHRLELELIGGSLRKSRKG